MADLELAEKEKMKEKVEMICKHDINVFINRQLIYNYPEQLFADKGKFFINFFQVRKVRKVLKSSLDSMPSPSLTDKIQRMGRKICWRRCQHSFENKKVVDITQQCFALLL